MEFVKSCGPYYFFITLTFGLNTSFNKRCQFTNCFLRFYNKKKFTKKFVERNHFLEGFAFFEDHPSSKFDERIHIHILIKNNDKFAGESFDEHEADFYKVIGNVSDGKDRRVFNVECVDIRPAGDEFRINYCMKEISDRSISDVKILTVEGLTDNVRRYE